VGAPRRRPRGVEDVLGPPAGPPGVPHGAVAPRPAEDAGREAAPAVARALGRGRHRGPWKLLEVVHRERQRLVDVPLDLQPPWIEIYACLNREDVLANEERVVLPHGAL